MKRFMNIFIATDFSIHSDFAVNLGKQIQEKTGGKATLIHISDVSPVWDFPASDIQAKNLLMQFQKEISVSLEKQIVDQKKRCSVNFESIVRFGNSQKELLSLVQSTNADLLIMGHRGNTNFFGIGSFAEKMIASSSVPVLIARNSKAIKNVTCLIDPARVSQESIAFTKDLAIFLKAKNQFLSFVADLSSASLMNVPFLTPTYKFSEQEKAQITEKAKSFILNETKTSSEDDIHIEISNLPAAKALSKALLSQRTDLAVVSRHNRGAIEKLFIGSISKGVLNEFEGNVLVLPS